MNVTTKRQYYSLSYPTTGFTSFADAAVFSFLAVLVVGVVSNIFNASNQASSELQAILTVLVGAIIYAVLLCKGKAAVTVRMTFLLSFLIRLLLLFIDLYGRSWMPLLHSGGDSEGFWQAALSYDWNKSTWYGGLYTQYLYVLINLVGEQRLIIQYFNLLYSMLSISVVYKALLMLDIDQRSSVFALVIMSVFPNYAILSVINLRESIITMLVAFSLYKFILWWKKGKISHAFSAIIFVVIAALFHSGVIGLAIVYAIFAVIYKPIENRFAFSLRSVTIAFSILLGFMLIYSLYGNQIMRKFSNVDSIDSVVGAVGSSGRGGSAYQAGIPISNPFLSIIINSPIRAVAFLLSPFPWQWRGISDIASFVFSSLFYVYTSYLGVRSLRMADQLNRPLHIMVVLAACSCAFVFGWGVSNSGTAMRHRDKALPVFIVLFALSYSMRQRKVKKAVK